MTKQTSIDAYKHFGNEATKYSENYRNDNFLEVYPHHVYRLNIFLNLLAKIKPAHVLDVGCGSGEPLLRFLHEGYDACGFDYSSAMVDQARQLLTNSNLDPNRVSQNNMEQIANISPGEFDCILGLGTLYYSRNFQSTVHQIANLLPKEGNLIFSLRNELFSLFSMNSYTADFLLEKLIPNSRLSSGLRGRLTTYLDEKLKPMGAAKKFQTIDDKKVHSLYHNPLTVEKEILKPNGLSLKGIYYYHFHALPPEFEHSDIEEFRKLSSDLENASDWRGMFMCSTFVVHATKND